MDYGEYYELRSLGSNTMDRIVSLLKESPQTASQIAEILCMHRVTISNILNDLKRSGITESLKVGRKLYYAIKDK